MIRTKQPKFLFLALTQKISKHKKFTAALFGVFFIKFLLAGLFSSDFQDTLFVPFVQHFLSASGNPWAHASTSHIEFPYMPIMLYLLAPAQATASLFTSDAIFLKNLLFKFPNMAADACIFWILLRWFWNKRWSVLLFYGVSPIVLYATYMHSQLDLIPTAFLLGALFLLFKRHLMWAACLFAVTICIKAHILIALPIVFLYVYKRFGMRIASLFLLPTLALAIVSVYPYWDPAFFAMAFQNPKQLQILDSTLQIGTIQIYLPLLATLLLYVRFSSYKQVNSDLLMLYLGIVFSIFVLLVPPAPGWYLWLLPFLIYFFVKFGKNWADFIALFVLNSTYLIYFIFAYQADYLDLSFLGTPVQYKFLLAQQGFVFTLLVASLIIIISAFYRIGLRNNMAYMGSGITAIGIGGDSGSGKTWLKNNLLAVLGKNCVDIEGDGDHKWERGNAHWAHTTHLDPKANFLHRQAQDLFRLKHWQGTIRSDYDHDTGLFRSPAHYKPAHYVLLSGLHPFYLPALREHIDIKIYLDPDESLRRFWKIRRDTTVRAYSIDKSLAQLEERHADAIKFIHPQKQFADIIVRFFTDASSPIESQEHPPIQLQLSIDIGLFLEPLFDIFTAHQFLFEWDYDPSMTYQQLSFPFPPSDAVLQDVQRLLSEEDFQTPLSLQSGYDGLIQLVILLYISHRRHRNTPYA